MKSYQLILAAVLALPALAQANDTGPTHPEPTREHPLDIREPRQDVIEPAGHDPQVPDETLPPTLDRPATDIWRPADATPMPEAGQDSSPGSPTN